MRVANKIVQNGEEVKLGAKTLAKDTVKSISLINGWVNGAGGTRVYKDVTGRVWCEGYIQGGTDREIGYLPAGYRPSSTIYTSSPSITSEYAEIKADGLIIFQGSAPARHLFQFSFLL